MVNRCYEVSIECPPRWRAGVKACEQTFAKATRIWDALGVKSNQAMRSAILQPGQAQQGERKVSARKLWRLAFRFLGPDGLIRGYP